jgi:hypothetical protein
MSLRDEYSRTISLFLIRHHNVRKQTRASDFLTA